MNSERPFTLVVSQECAPPPNERWVSSWSPPEIHILFPNSRWCRQQRVSARVATSASDEPACGSDRHMVPKNRPSTIGLTNVSICSCAG